MRGFALQVHLLYLGHVVSEGGIQTDPEKTDAIKTWASSVKDVRAFRASDDTIESSSIARPFIICMFERIHHFEQTAKK